MLKFLLDRKRAEPRPDRRLGIKLEAPISKRGLGGKLDAYVPPELRYDYKPPSAFAQYKILTAVFAALALGVFSYCVLVLRSSPQTTLLPAPPAAASKGSAPQVPPDAQRQPLQDQPVYVEPLPSK